MAEYSAREPAAAVAPPIAASWPGTTPPRLRRPESATTAAESPRGLPPNPRPPGIVHDLRAAARNDRNRFSRQRPPARWLPLHGQTWNRTSRGIGSVQTRTATLRVIGFAAPCLRDQRAPPANKSAAPGRRQRGRRLKGD